MSVPIQLGVIAAVVAWCWGDPAAFAALWAASLALLGYGLGREAGEREGSEG